MEQDVVVVGSCAGAQTADVVAAHSGLRVLVVEKASVFGGTGAMSGGVAWIPNNPHIPETGEQDSLERAFQYLQSVIGPERLRRDLVKSFIETGPRMVEFLEQNTAVQFERTTYPDYKSHLGGGMPVGRSIATREYDGRLLGDAFQLLKRPMPELCMLGSMMVDGADVQHLLNMTRSFASFRHATRRFVRFVFDRVRYGRGTRLVMILDVSPEFSFEGKSARDLADPIVQEWERLMWTFQQALPDARAGEKWQPMERIFSVDFI